MKALQQLFSDLGAVSPEAVGGSGFYAAASQNHQAWSTPHHVATGTPHPVATGTPHHVATGAPHHVATGAGRDQTALLAPVPQVAAPTVPLAPSPGRPGGRRALWVVLAALVLVGGGVGVALVATQSQRGPGPERPPVPPASDAKARLAAARSALAGLGDPAPPDTCPIEAAADAAELVLAAREAIATAPDRAIAAADNAIQKCPNAAAYNARGNALQKAGKLDAAGDAYNHALQLAPEYDAPRFNLGLLQIRAHDRSAIATFDEILRRKPDDADAHKARAQAYIDAKRFDDAATDLEKGLQGKGDDGAAWLLLGQLRDKTGRGDAREAYCKASTLGVQAAAALCKR
jgi:Flp pilus assembly protein TadD